VEGKPEISKILILTQENFVKMYKCQKFQNRKISFLSVHTQSKKLGLKDVFFGPYQYQIIKNWSSAGRKVVLFVARKTSLGFYWYFKRQASSRLCRDRFHTHKLSLTCLQRSKDFMNEKKTSFSDWVLVKCFRLTMMLPNN
jgi:hypothetical protein